MANVRPFEWFLGSFSTGEIINSVPMIEIGGGEIDLSVDNEDTAEIEISTGVAPSNIRNNWSSYYKEVLHYAGCKNIETGDIVWAGMINKITPDIKKQSLSFQLVNPKEYMQARIVGENFDTTVENPNAGITFTGATWVDIVGKIVKRCFAPISGSVPQPPNILGNVSPEPSDGEVSFEVLFSDALSYKEAMQQAIDESGEDLETRFTARHVEAEGRIVWDFNIGTMDNPHINESTNLEISIDLINDEDRFKISEFQNEIDSTELFNSFYISSKAGDSEKNTGMDLKNSVTNTTGFPILLEKYYNPGVELTESQINKQLNAYISNGMDYKRTGSISLELEDHRFKTWASNYLGRVISFTGFDNTLSAGYTSKLRIVGVRLDTLTGRVILDLMTKMQKYPRLPRKKSTESKKDRSKSPSNRLIRQRDIKNIKPGGGTTVPPWEAGGTYPPTDGGYGSENGTGSETVKTDSQPYLIENYIKNASTETNLMSWQAAQSQKNLCFFLSGGNIGQGMEWLWDSSKPVYTTENSINGNIEILSIGRGYLSEGTLMNPDFYKFTLPVSEMVDKVIFDINKSGITFPETFNFDQYGYQNYLYLSRFIINQIRMTIVRDKLVFVFDSSVFSLYDGGSQLGIGAQFIFYMNITNYDDLSYPLFLHNSTIRVKSSEYIADAMFESVSRVGDYLIVSTKESYYVANFSDPNLVNANSWYSIPNLQYVNDVELMNEFVIGKVNVNGSWKRYLAKLAGSYEERGRVYGIELTLNGAPVVSDESAWYDISDFFPVPASMNENTVCLDSLSGYLIYRIGGTSSNRIMEEVYMQGEDGTWYKLGIVNQVNRGITPMSFQYGNWVYFINPSYINGVSLESFKLKKVPDWNDSESVGSVPPASP